MPILQDFKKFVIRGNMVDLAIGFTVGAAFTTVVKSLVSDIIMPPVGLITGNADFADQFYVLKYPEGGIPAGGFDTLADAQAAGAVTINYGTFINQVLALLIVALAMFIIVRMVNRLDEQMDEAFGEDPPQPEEPTEKKCEYCRSAIPYRAIRCPQCTSDLVEKLPAETA